MNDTRPSTEAKILNNILYINLLLAVLDTVSGHSSAVEVVVRGGESELEVFTLSYTRHLLATTLLPWADPAQYTAYLTAQLAGYSVSSSSNPGST